MTRFSEARTTAAASKLEIKNSGGQDVRSHWFDRAYRICHCEETARAGEEGASGGAKRGPSEFAGVARGGAVCRGHQQQRSACKGFQRREGGICDDSTGPGEPRLCGLSRQGD